MTELTTPVEFFGVWDVRGKSSPESLPCDVVHVWQLPLHESTALEQCYELLSPEERERAARFRVERAFRQFVLTRGTLRSLLGSYLGTESARVNLGYTAYGKPFLKETDDLCFNVSHTDGMALLAFVRRREIGVDVEKISTVRDIRQLARRFFSLHEQGRLELLSDHELPVAFFRCWTRKEAYIKAIGEGLSLPLHQFDVSVAPNDANALLATRPDPSEANRWIVSDLSFNPEYAAAVAVGVNAES